MPVTFPLQNAYQPWKEVNRLLEEMGFMLRKGSVGIVLGGPMMGSTVGSLDVPVAKAVSGILALAGQRDRRRCAPCLSVHQLRRIPARLPDASQSLAPRPARRAPRVPGHGTTLSPRRLLRMRQLHLCLPGQHPAGALFPYRQGHLREKAA